MKTQYLYSNEVVNIFVLQSSSLSGLARQEHSPLEEISDLVVWFILKFLRFLTIPSRDIATYVTGKLTAVILKLRPSPQFVAI